MPTIKLIAGEDTEDLLAFVTQELDDKTLDSVKIKREHEATAGLASEPTVIAAIMTLTPIVAIAVTRLVERWLESRRQEKQMEIVTKGFAKGDKVGRALTELATKYADVAVSFGPLPALSQTSAKAKGAAAKGKGASAKGKAKKKESR